MKRALLALLWAPLAGCSASDSSGATVSREGATPSGPTGLVNDMPQGAPSMPGATPNSGSGSGDFGSEDVSSGVDENNCGLQYFNVDRRPADVLLVLDRSASMQDAPDDAGTATSKWDLTVPALNQVILETDSAVAWGMKSFPEGEDTDACSPETIVDTIHVPIAPANANVVVQAIDATTPDGDGTPTGDAIRSAVRYLGGLQTPNRKFIVLATDGEPSCSPSGEGGEDARPYAVSAVADSLAAGIPVFVVGVSTNKDTATEALNDMARAGGAARSDPNPLATRYYLANTQAELVSSLQAITGEIATCVFPLSARPPVPDNIAVKVDGTLVPRDPTRSDGWEYTSDALGEVEVHGSWCDQIKGAAASDVQVIYACEGVIIR
ncbi:MAG TPA: vWA domain-containing protein [Polyangiaceae bacterium]|nr:vWA domain-containing protein [Polyangiaceae bacterium]